MRRLHAMISTLALAAAFGAAQAADGPVVAGWPAIDELVEVDLLTLEKLKEPIVIDMETGAGSERCPGKAWTGRATYLFPDGEELVYIGTGIYCAPIGYGRIQYSDGRSYTGQVNSFLESSAATLTQHQFRPAVRHGNGKLNSKGAASKVGSFQRGAFSGDRSQDQAFLKSLDAAEASLPDRSAPILTSAVAAFLALPAGGTAVATSDSIADAGAAAKQGMATPSATAMSAPMPSAPAGGSGGSLFTAAAAGGVAASGAGAGSYNASGMLALPAPLPSEYSDMAGMMGFQMPSPEAVAQAKQIDKELNLKTRNNGIFYGASCPKAGFLGLKNWRARVIFTETFSGRIVYDGVGLSCFPIGPGRIEFEDGSVFEGQVSSFARSPMNAIGNFEPAVPSGPGRFTFPDGTVVEGTWLRGELNGGPITVTRRGGQPQAMVSGTLAGLRGGGQGGGMVASAPAGAAFTAQASAPAGATAGAAPSSFGAAPPGSTPAMQTAAAAAASAMLSSSAPSGTATPFTAATAGATPFTPAGGSGLPFTPAGAGAVEGVAAAPGKAGPQPMLGNSGKYLCPYTEDGVVAPWVDKAIKARMGGAIGGMVGAEVGKELFKNIPMFGGMFGKAAGDKIGRETAIKMAGGWEFIRANTDQSFDNVHEFVAWMKANYAGTEHYKDVVAAIKELYPELKTMQF